MRLKNERNIIVLTTEKGILWHFRRCVNLKYNYLMDDNVKG